MAAVGRQHVLGHWGVLGRRVCDGVGVQLGTLRVARGSQRDLGVMMDGVQRVLGASRQVQGCRINVNTLFWD